MQIESEHIGIPDQTSFGMNVKSLGKLFKMGGPSESMKMRWENDAHIVCVKCEGTEDDRIADFDPK